MKHYLILFLLFSFCSISLGQTTSVIAGLNMANHVRNSLHSASKEHTSYRPGFHVGIMGSIKLNHGLHAEGGFILDQKGTNYESERMLTNSSIHNSDKVSLYYLDVPVRLRYQVDLSESLQVYIGAGFYLGTGLFGNGTYKSRVNDHEVEEHYDVPWWDLKNNDDYDLLDAGFSGNLGFSSGKFLIEASYDRSLKNIADTESDLKIYNQCFRISAGYYFIKLEE